VGAFSVYCGQLVGRVGLLHTISHLPKGAPAVQIAGAMLIGSLFFFGGLFVGFVFFPMMEWPRWYQLPIAFVIVIQPIGLAFVGGKIILSALLAIRR
jgi:hypothetical protein